MAANSDEDKYDGHDTGDFLNEEDKSNEGPDGKGMQKDKLGFIYYNIYTSKTRLSYIQTKTLNVLLVVINSLTYYTKYLVLTASK